MHEKKAKKRKTERKMKRTNRFTLHHSMDEVHMGYIIQQEMNRITHTANIPQL